ncbi:hypothetical protein BB558_004035 [Smittium angustum]|uniref:Isopropylmalate dehydrogenase-like domain-containing protein n=1 Tax=Smittium angustum TaxID=133377 RepID=A0A2U1IZR8_SMIAN|nr:hypothetical protein BB558_005730 [Smittium angustum]PVZ99936.1 hypothetical protein BB558_004035 [Smittium angustum]
MNNRYNIDVIPSDGIGPEVTKEAVKVLKKVSEMRAKAMGGSLHFAEYYFGRIAIDNHGNPLPSSTLEACKSASAVILGAVGGPQWPRPLDASNP